MYELIFAPGPPLPSLNQSLHNCLMFCCHMIFTKHWKNSERAIKQRYQFLKGKSGFMTSG